jgi:hypothetical protein
MQLYFEEMAHAAASGAITLRHFLLGCIYFPGELYVEDPMESRAKE